MHFELPLAAIRAHFSDLLLKAELRGKRKSNLECFVVAGGLIIFSVEEKRLWVLFPLLILVFFFCRLVSLIEAKD